MIKISMFTISILSIIIVSTFASNAFAYPFEDLELGVNPIVTLDTVGPDDGVINTSYEFGDTIPVKGTFYYQEIEDVDGQFFVYLVDTDTEDILSAFSGLNNPGPEILANTTTSFNNALSSVNVHSYGNHYRIDYGFHDLTHLDGGSPSTWLVSQSIEFVPPP